MTPEEFIAKFPNVTTVNEGNLEDVACPQCGARDGFGISFHGWAKVTDESSDDAGDHEWDMDSSASCPECGHSDLLAGLTIKGLDAALEEQQQAENEDEEEQDDDE